MLCLGSDAPIGGLTKLLRKLWFTGPQEHGGPVTYTGGSDLRWGVRVVAAYGHGTDVFTQSQAEQRGISQPFTGLSLGLRAAIVIG